MRVKQAVLMLAAGIMTVGLAGCGQKTKDYDVYFFNSKSEIAESLDELAMEYEAETGKRVKTFTVGTTESAETMRSELKSRDYPTVFTSNAVAFEEWKSAGFAVGVDGIMNPELKALYEELPDTIKLQFDGEGNYGIPYNIEGYGLIADRRMIMDILGLDDIQTFQEDYAEAGYEEFQNMVVAMDAFIKGKPGQTFTLNGKPYAAAGGESGIAKNLNGVFSIAGAEKWTYGNHFGNYPISAVYKDIYDVRGADASKADQMLEPLVKSLQELDFLTRYAAGADGPVERGPRFINSTVTGYDQAVQTFAEGKAVFIKNGNWIYSNVAN
ncbi:MAG: extracellular solute-binding protein [Hungatella hathewayi]